MTQQQPNVSCLSLPLCVSLSLSHTHPHPTPHIKIQVSSLFLFIRLFPIHNSPSRYRPGVFDFRAPSLLSPIISSYHLSHTSPGVHGLSSVLLPPFYVYKYFYIFGDKRSFSYNRQYFCTHVGKNLT